MCSSKWVGADSSTPLGAIYTRHGGRVIQDWILRIPEMNTIE